MLRGQPSGLGLAAAALAGAVAVFYVVLIVNGTVGTEGSEGYVAGVTVVLFAQTALATFAAFRKTVLALSEAAGMLLVTGFLGLFSIGAPLLVAGMLAAMGAAVIQLRRARAQSGRR